MVFVLRIMSVVEVTANVRWQDVHVYQDSMLKVENANLMKVGNSIYNHQG